MCQMRAILVSLLGELNKEIREQDASHITKLPHKQPFPSIFPILQIPWAQGGAFPLLMQRFCDV